MVRRIDVIAHPTFWKTEIEIKKMFFCLASVQTLRHIFADLLLKIAEQKFRITETHWPNQQSIFV